MAVTAALETCIALRPMPVELRIFQIGPVLPPSSRPYRTRSRLRWKTH